MADASDLIIGPGFSIAATFSATNFALDANNDAVEWNFYAREAMTITRIGFRYGARTGTPPTYRASIQGVAAAGTADGTVKGGGSPASVTFTPPADATWDGTWRWVTLANAYTCTRGEPLAIVIDYSAGTVDASNNSSFTVSDAQSLYNGSDGLSYAVQVNAGSKARQQVRPVFAYSSASKVYGNPAKSAFLNNTLTSATTPDELAMRFMLPAGWTDRYQLQGVNVRMIAGATKTLKAILYNGTTPVATCTHDTDHSGAAASTRVHRLIFQDSSLPVLRAGSVYRVGFQPQDAAGAYSFYGITQDSNAEWDAYPLGIEWYMSSRTDGGAWSDDTTTRLLAELVFQDISGGGSHFIG